MAYPQDQRRLNMSPVQTTEFKIATEDWEFEQIHKLNYQTFAEEIPQHPPESSKRLIDRFHRDNTYIVCVHGRQLLAMLSINEKRPFSLDQKLENLNSYLPRSQSICELRLLSIQASYRGGRILKGLLKTLEKFCIERRYDLAILSGLEAQQKLYSRLGFVPFGPLVGPARARYQPMYLTLETFATDTKAVLNGSRSATQRKRCVNLLPGPVNIAKKVRDAFIELPLSHRSNEFVDDLVLLKDRLCRLARAPSVEIFSGSGTLANDVIAGQLSLLPGRGLVLSNGEFGQRLAKHATTFGLSFDTHEADWGATFDNEEIEHKLDQISQLDWIWAVHCETSTGVLNDMRSIEKICSRRSIRLCMDCVSSIGTVPIDLSGIYLASGVSGKGLGAYPGLAMVYYNHTVAPAPERLPRCLDLGYFADENGVPFTISSNLVYALRTALKKFESGNSFDSTDRLSRWTRKKLGDAGFQIVGPERHFSPGIITLALPGLLDSRVLGQRLEEEGFCLGYNSRYLLKRNWIQIALMGEVSQELLERLCNSLCALNERLKKNI
jgi:aspartate aminotransferase-like enzyme